MQRLLPVEYFKDHREFEQQLVACEICAEKRQFRDMNSMACVYRMPGTVDHGHRIERKASYQCPDIQHFGCCHDHAMLACLQCMFYHIHEGPHHKQGEDHEDELLLKIRALLEELIHEEAVEGEFKEDEAAPLALPAPKVEEVQEEEMTPEQKAKDHRKKSRHSTWQS